jgi:hypothetical protein
MELDDHYQFTNLLVNTTWKSLPGSKWLTLEVQTRVVEELQEYLNSGMNENYGKFVVGFAHINSILMYSQIYYEYVQKKSLLIISKPVYGGVPIRVDVDAIGRATQLLALNTIILNGIYYYHQTALTFATKKTKFCCMQEFCHSAVDQLTPIEISQVVEYCEQQTDNIYQSYLVNGTFKVQCETTLDIADIADIANKVQKRTHTFYFLYTPQKQIMMNAYEALSEATANFKEQPSTNTLIMQNFSHEFLTDIEKKFTTAVEQKNFHVTGLASGVILYEINRHFCVQGVQLCDVIMNSSKSIAMFEEATKRINGLCSTQLKKVSLKFVFRTKTTENDNFAIIATIV